MEKKVENRVTLTWNFEGKFEALIINAKIESVSFCEPGSGGENCEKCLTSTDYKHLQHVYTALGELFKALEDENKRLGYRYAKEPDSTETKTKKHEQSKVE